MANSDYDDPLIADEQPSTWFGGAVDSQPLQNVRSQPQTSKTGDTQALLKPIAMPKKQIFCRNYEHKEDTVLVNVPVPSTAIGESNVFTHSSYHAARSNCFLAWLSLLCFLPIGSISVLFSCMSAHSNRRKDYASALAHGKTAHKLALAGVIAGAVLYTVLVIVASVSAISGGKRLNGTENAPMEFGGFGI